MPLTIRPITEADARIALAWRYDPPYESYNIQATESDIAMLLDPQYHYLVIMAEDGTTAALGCYGYDAQVEGGDYSVEAIDIGLGIRPDLTGRGLGGQFVRLLIDHAIDVFAPPRLRVSIAAFNQRAQTVWLREGFKQVQQFEREGDQRPFVVLVREL